MTSPYLSQPIYADVEYIDGKLKVARGIVSRTSDSNLKDRWQKTIDSLLDQRSMLFEVERGDYR